MDMENGGLNPLTHLFQVERHVKPIWRIRSGEPGGLPQWPQWLVESMKSMCGTP